MKRLTSSKKINLLDLVKKITQEVEKSNPSIEQMIEEIKMMQFKIRPIAGDIFQLLSQKHAFLTWLWRIGKVDEIVSRYLKNLTPKEREIVFDYLNRWYEEYEKKMASSFLSFQEKPDPSFMVLELEVFRRKIYSKKQLN